MSCYLSRFDRVRAGCRASVSSIHKGHVDNNYERLEHVANNTHILKQRMMFPGLEDGALEGPYLLRSIFSCHVRLIDRAWRRYRGKRFHSFSSRPHA
jgi:hypothetical protein